MRSLPKERMKTLRGTRKHEDTQQHESEEQEGEKWDVSFIKRESELEWGN